MTIITRKRRDNFAIIPNAVASDERLSFEARGLLVYLLAKPHDWKVSIGDLQRSGGIGRDRAYKLLKELEDAHYLTRERTRREGGRMGPFDYTIFDDPMPQELALGPCPEKPDVVTPCAENQDADQPRPENPGPGQPDMANQDAYKEQILQITPPPPLQGGSETEFQRLVSIWPVERLGKRDAADREFLALTEDKRRRALDCGPTFLRHQRLRGEEIPRLSVYLASQRFELVYDAPDVDERGYYRIHPERPEWRPWIEHIRTRFGSEKADRQIAEKLVLAKRRWPDGENSKSLRL